MPTLEAFFSASKAILTLGAGANAKSRADIRNTVGALADELERALSLADSYLAGARYVKDTNELADYLGNVYSKLLTDFSEHKVCAGLYQLADEFKQLFSPRRLSVSVSQFNEIPALIERLKDGERAVLDSLDDTTTELQNIGHELRSAAPGQRPALRRKIESTIARQRTSLDALRKKIKALRRKLVDTL